MADTPESLEPKILELLKKNGKMSLGELQKALGIKRPSYTEQNQHKMPLNQALIKLRDSGKISTPSKSFGDPIFDIKASMTGHSMRGNQNMKKSSLKFAAKYLLKVARQLQADKSVKAFLHEIEVKDVKTVSKIGTTMNKYWTITDGSGKRTVYNDFNKFKEKLMPALHSNQQHFDQLMKDLEKHAGEQKKQIEDAMAKNSPKGDGFMAAAIKNAVAERNDVQAGVASRIADAFMADEPKPWGKGEWQSYKQEHPQTKVHPKFTPPQNQHKSPKAAAPMEKKGDAEEYHGVKIEWFTMPESTTRYYVAPSISKTNSSLHIENIRKSIDKHLAKK